jgi:plastocyanin
MARLKDFPMFKVSGLRGLTVMAAALSLSGAIAGSSGARATGREPVVTISNMSFGAIPSGLKVGDSVVFVNRDSVPHTVTARDHSFDLRIGPGQSRQLTLSKAGTFPIYCILHSPMRATLSVAAK